MAAKKPTEKRGTKDGKPGVWVTYANGDKFFRPDPAKPSTPPAATPRPQVSDEQRATIVNNAWAAANPGKASPNGTVFNPVEKIADLPAGSVDPALTYQAGAARRGLGYQSDDYNRNFGGTDVGLNTRPEDWDATVPLLDHEGNPVLDPATGQPRVVPKYGRAVRDYWQNVDRTNQQYGWEHDDADTTRNRTLADLFRDFQVLGNNQLQAINQAGVLGGGALAQALAKRQAAQSRVEGRVNEDYQTVWGAGGRAETAKGQTLADLLTGTQRGATDAHIGLQRAIGENAPYQATLFQQAVTQATPALVGNPAYEVHNGRMYIRTPGGGLQSAPAAPKPPTAPKPSGRPSYVWGGGRNTPFGPTRRGGFTY